MLIKHHNYIVNICTFITEFAFIAVDTVKSLIFVGHNF